ncbi:MAG: radical SAM protein [Treponema sp.]|nr:radical SAM protein [Treponema sp.]
MSPYQNCRLCPRRCGADREHGVRGYCGETSQLRVAFAGIHRGEEPPVTGSGGSGTIFISGCNLGCAFCQNYQLSKNEQLSKGTIGRAVDSDEFAEICLDLQNRGAENINIVTGSHAAPAIAAGIGLARNQGLKIPVLWNSSGYDGMESLEILKDCIDVYLPDLKTLDPVIAAKFFYAPDYPEYAKAAILKMMEFKELRFGPCAASGSAAGATAAAGAVTQTMTSGVMIRHLILPGYLDSTRQVLAWFAKNCAGRALLSLMTQYTPVRIPGVRTEIPSRYINEAEYEAVVSMLEEFGIDDGYCQELVTGLEWLPDFNRPNPFSSQLSVPVWHFKG